ncbi:hypothetical protein J0H58_10595, partial [bacterium]|nr:hypothetical protein [bacterium]
NRALGVGPPLVKAAELLRDRTRGRPATAGRELALPARVGVAARTARLSAAADTVTIRPRWCARGTTTRRPWV